MLSLLFASLLLLNPVPTDAKESSFSPSLSDHFCFGRYWDEIRPFAQEGFVAELIDKRRQEITDQKEKWRLPIEQVLKPANLSFYVDFEEILNCGTLASSEEGMGSAYFLIDYTGKKRFIVKPFDEDILCLNNRKLYGTPFNNHVTRVRKQIPLYRSCFADALASDIAETIGLVGITPKAELVIINSAAFYDISRASGEKEKLCSVQKYVEGTEELYVQIQKWLEAGFSDEEIGEMIDQKDFEAAALFIWLCFDADAHAGNFLTYRKSNGLYGLIKIDNNLTFPDKNHDLKNSLMLFPNAEMELSQRMQHLIENLPLDVLIEKIRSYQMDACIPSFKERVYVLQELVKKKKMSLKNIDLRLSMLELPDGVKLALSSLHEETLKRFKGGE